jgi:hypothetical protein
VLSEPPLLKTRFKIALDGAKKTRAEILACMYGHDRLALVALDDDVGALLPQLDAAAFPKKSEQILAGQTLRKHRAAGPYVKSVDRYAGVTSEGVTAASFCARLKNISTSSSSRRIFIVRAPRTSS